jgi:hypothetical protein
MVREGMNIWPMIRVVPSAYQIPGTSYPMIRIFSLIILKNIFFNKVSTLKEGGIVLTPIRV